MFTILHSKTRFYYLEPRPEDVYIEDIAHALSQICRFTGHTSTFYSVAQHSILVSRFCPVGFKLYGLLHDAAEAYVGDVASPLKRLIGTSYRDIEINILRVIFKKYGLTKRIPPEVKEIDRDMTTHELRFFVDETYWEKGYRPIMKKIEPWSALESKKHFLRRFNGLMARNGGTNDTR